jgi:hypothetical protein
VPTPDPYDKLITSASELKIKAIPMDDVDSELSPSPVPIPEPSCDPCAVTVEFQIARTSILEVPALRPLPVPIPEPHSEVATILEFQIVTIAT